MRNNDRRRQIDQLARAFVQAATSLGEALADQLEDEDPALAFLVGDSLQRGERMLLALEFGPEAPAIRWSTVDDYQQMKRIMSIAGQPAPHH